MTDSDFNATTSTTMKTGVPNYKVSAKTLDSAGPQDETYYTNDNWPVYLGYLKSIPEYFQALKSLARFTVGLGFEVVVGNAVLLENIKGWGEDSLQSILSSMIIEKKANGDSYAEVIRNDTDGLINLKKLNPSKVRHVVGKNGILKRYDVQNAEGEWKEKEVWEIFHLCNDRIGDEIHGTSVMESCKWVIDAKNEAMSDWRRISHRSSIRVMYIDETNTTRLLQVKTEYATAIKSGELMLIPAKKGDAEFVELTLPPIEAFMRWIEYLDNFFYQAVGVNRTIAGGLDQTEAGQKMGYMTFEPTYTEEQTLLESDIWNQLAVKVKFNRPPSLSGMMRQDEIKNSGMLGMQPNEATMNLGQQT